MSEARRANHVPGLSESGRALKTIDALRWHGWLGEKVPVGDIKDRLKSLQTAENTQETFTRFTEHLADNKLDPQTTELSFGPNLALDVANEKFVGNADADAMLTRDYRAPFVVPAAGQV